MPSLGNYRPFVTTITGKVEPLLRPSLEDRAFAGNVDALIALVEIQYTIHSLRF